MKSIYIISLLLCANFLIHAQTKSVGSDSIDIIKYDIRLNISDLPSQSIAGYTDVIFETKVNNLNYVPLDLLALNVDSIYYKNNKLSTYTYNDTLLMIQVPSALAISTIDTLRIYYQGNPIEDPSTWGGFYFSGDYAYNLGVGFESDPHNFGRVWFPCIDDFIDKAYYDIHITTDTANMAVCGGSLIDSTLIGDSLIMWQWTLADPIPTYLASVAVGPYVCVSDTFHSVLGDIPIGIYVPSNLISQTNGSFANLKNILAAYETHYGPYRWERVGYVGVPFNYGAMEHACNIAYPLAVINGSLTYEFLLAHELSHHWFGDLVTCSSAEEMWINEGWAVFSEFIFEEFIYGTDAANNYIRNKHADVLKKAHYDDGGFYPVCNVPHNITYGSTVYDKGAMIVHTLRHYMGDSLFFSTVQQYTDSFKFDNITCAEMRDYFTTISGINLNDFFDAWVFREGFPHFSVDSFATQQNGSYYDVTVYMKQKLFGTNQYANSNKIELTFMNNQWESYTAKVEFSGITGSYIVNNIPFSPDLIICDKDEKTADAIISYNQVFKNTGSSTFGNAYTSIEVIQYIDSIYYRVEHHKVAPDSVKNNSSIYRLSPNHYWTIGGIIPDETVFSAQFDYNKVPSANTGYIDVDLLPAANSADSLILVYRRNSADDWVITQFTKFGNVNIGKIKAINAKAGEYSLAIGEPNQAGLEETLKTMQGLNVYPNPGSTFTIEINEPSTQEIIIIDINGKTVFTKDVSEGETEIIWFPSNITTQHYFVYGFDENGNLTGLKKILYSNK